MSDEHTHLLIKVEANWADEMDVFSIEVKPIDEQDYVEDVIMQLKELAVDDPEWELLYVGTNQSVDADDIKITFEPITQERADHLIAAFGGTQYGNGNLEIEIIDITIND